MPPRPDGEITEKIFDSLLMCVTDCDLIESYIHRGAPLSAETLIRALFWENPEGVRVLLDNGVEIPTDIFSYITWFNKTDIFGDRNALLRQLLAHPRINEREFDHLDFCRSIAEEVSQERTIQRTLVFKKELMERTWEPRRHVDWCLAASEKTL